MPYQNTKLPLLLYEIPKVSPTCGVTQFTEDLCLSAIDSPLIGRFIEGSLFCFALSVLIRASRSLCAELERLCVLYNIPEGVAGATVLAWGGSLPEITVNILSCMKAVAFATSSDQQSTDLGVGLGAILGSGLIAFLVIPSLCVLWSGNLILTKEETREAALDFAAYSAMLIVVAAGRQISAPRASMLLAIYVGYLVVLLREKSKGEVEIRVPLLEEPSGRKRDLAHELNDKTFRTIGRRSPSPEHSSLLTILPSSPWATSLSVLLPSAALLAFGSFIVTGVVGRWASFPESSPLVSFLLLSAGTEIPDFINTLTAASRGHAGMAIGGLVGAQVVNLGVGLGFPWFVAGIAAGRVGSCDADSSCASSLFIGSEFVPSALGVVTLSVAFWVVLCMKGAVDLGRRVAWLMLIGYCASLVVIAVITRGV